MIFILNAVVYLALNLFLLGMGIGLGFLLHWLFPDVDLGMGILIGVLAAIAAVHFHTRVLNALDEYEYEPMLMKMKVQTKPIIPAITPHRRIERKERSEAGMPNTLNL